jgi:hypothetical protein
VTNGRLQFGVVRFLSCSTCSTVVFAEITAWQKLGIGFADGQERLMLVTAVDGESLTIDGNNPWRV